MLKQATSTAGLTNEGVADKLNPSGDLTLSNKWFQRFLNRGAGQWEEGSDERRVERLEVCEKDRKRNGVSGMREFDREESMENIHHKRRPTIIAATEKVLLLTTGMPSSS